MEGAVPRRATGTFPRETKLSRYVYAHIPTRGHDGRYSYLYTIGHHNT